MDPVLTRPVSRFRREVLRSATRTSRLVAAGLSLAVLLGGVSLASAQAIEPIAYTIRAPAPESHIAEIEASFPTGRQPSIELMMPVWSPGFYRIETYADKIQDLSARTSDGTALQVEKTRANRWRVATNGAPRVSVSYRLSCTGRSVTTNTVGTDLGVFNGAATFITLVEHTKRPHDVRLELAPTWQQSMSGLAPGPDGAPDHYRAADFDTLVDSPILAGNLVIDRFDVGGRTHYVIAGGDTSQWTGATAAADLKKIVEAAQQFWGALPYTRYVFLIALRQGGGGLEHMNSAFVNSSPAVMATPRSYTSWLSFMSHEYFHAFNVKRLRPLELGPFDYETPPRTTSLWISEGVTSYYGNLLVLRAGLSTIDDFLGSMSSQIDQLQKAPGRLAQTLEQSSADVWTNSTSGVNANSGTVSYYIKGQVVGFLLDAHVRRLTNNSKSFDDVMRAAFERYAGKQGFTSEQFQTVASRVAGVDLKDWFRKAIASTEELGYAEALDWYGLRFAKAEDGGATWRLEQREDATAAQKQRLASLSSSAVAQTAEAMRARAEQIHDAPATSIGGVRLMRPDAVVHFFQARDFRPAWTIPAASDEILKAIRASDGDGLNPADYHLAALESVLGGKKTAPDVDVQLFLTDAVAALIDHVRYGKVKPQTLDRHWNVDPRAGAPALDVLVAQVAAAPTAATIDTLKPNHFIYAGLRGALARYRDIAARGGWPLVLSGPPIKPDEAAGDKRIAAIRARLVASGELPAANTSGDTYDAILQAAVKTFQERHRLTPDAVVGKTTIDAMNVTAEARANQVRVNLERVRWVIGGLFDSFLLVNLPAFKVYAIKDRKNIWEARTMIGRTARQTPPFRADLRYIVFNPDWTVPPTILAKDVLDGMRTGTNPIAKQNLTILDRQGRPVSPDQIDWKTAQAANFPYTLRQAPGPDNALGRVKFIFPNEHSIFLHDTPHRELFSSDFRTFSSGCIRVERPLELAATLLQGQDDWTPEKIARVVAAGQPETVFLKQSLPVLIVYWTVSVGASGDVHFARDVYNRDPAVLRGLNAVRAE